MAEDLHRNPWVTRPVAAGGLGFDTQWDDLFVDTVRAVLAQPRDEDRSAAAVAAALRGPDEGGWRSRPGTTTVRSTGPTCPPGPATSRCSGTSSRCAATPATRPRGCAARTSTSTTSTTPTRSSPTTGGPTAARATTSSCWPTSPNGSGPATGSACRGPGGGGCG